MSATWYGLAEALAGVPRLEGAACAIGKRYELFDVEDADDEGAGGCPQHLRLAHRTALSCAGRLLRLVRLAAQRQPPPGGNDRGQDLRAAEAGAAEGAS